MKEEDCAMSIEREVYDFVTSKFLLWKSIDLQPEDLLLDKGVVDSNGVLELVNFIQEQYEIKVTDRELIASNFDSIRHITAYVVRKLG